MFAKIKPAPADPILGLSDTIKADKRLDLINLSIGIYQNEVGETPVLNSVKKAEQILLNNEKDKNYLPINGLENFNYQTQVLLFGEQSEIITTKRACTVQTPGGTGALRIAADFLFREAGIKRIWLSRPSWPNHKNIFSTAGFTLLEYCYFDAQQHALDFAGMLQNLQHAKTGDVVLLHACCHNPTGVDPTAAQWQTLATLSQQNGWLPLFDCAYQGFGRGLEEDAAGMRIFAEMQQEFIVCNSYSKNFGLYNERAGACSVVTANQSVADTVLSQLKKVIRANYSNPPAHGAKIVATILSDHNLCQLWQNELVAMRERIQRMRHLFVNTLKLKDAPQDFSFIMHQQGMFSFSGLTETQVDRLRQKFGIYVLSSGRINVAGMTTQKMAPLCEAITAVL